MSKKKISAEEMKKMMAGLKNKQKKRPQAKPTTDDVIALKKIKLLQEGKLTSSAPRWVHLVRSG